MVFPSSAGDFTLFCIDAYGAGLDRAFFIARKLPLYGVKQFAGRKRRYEDGLGSDFFRIGKDRPRNEYDRAIVDFLVQLPA